MRGLTHRRGISTAVDVALFLLLVSAAVTMLVYGLEGEEDDCADPERIAETLAATTTAVEYTLEPIADRDDTGTFDDADFESEAYERVGHGPVAGLLAEAAVTNVRIEGERLTHAGEDFEDAVERNALSTLEGEPDVHVFATWKPYEGASIEGQASAGRTPPPDVDVSTATMTVSSGLAPVDERAVAAGYDADGFEGASRPIANAIVEGYLPAEESQFALERQGIDRALVVYRYQRFADVLEVDLDAEEGSLSRSGADAVAANERLAEELATIIAADLEDTLESELERLEDEYPAGERDVVIGETIAAHVLIDQATITVRTW